jgi:hypothetical protein
VTDERDILDRLRESVSPVCECRGCAPIREAADELARLRGERVGYEEALHGAAGANDELRREVARLRAEAGRPRVLTDDQLRFVVLVLDGSQLDPSWEDVAVEEAREDVRRRYRGLRDEQPALSYGERSTAARVAWLREYLAGLMKGG